MTTLEIILTSIVSLAGTIMGGRFFWRLLIVKSNNKFTLKKARLEKDEQDIRNLQNILTAVKAELELVKTQNAQLIASFKVILPLLEAMAKDDPGLKAAIDVVKEIVIEK